MIYCQLHVSLPEKSTEEHETRVIGDEKRDSDTKYLEKIDGTIQSKHNEPLSLADDSIEMPVQDSFPQDVSPDVKVVETTSGLEPVIRQGDHLVEGDGYESSITPTGW